MVISHSILNFRLSGQYLRLPAAWPGTFHAFILILLFVQSPFNKLEVDGSQSVMRFHERMAAAYQRQRREFDNSRHVQAKLDPSLYRQFYAILKEQNLSMSRGIQDSVKLFIAHHTNE